MTGVEIDFVVPDSLEALRVYESIFQVVRVEVTAYPRGQNEAVFTIYGTRIHMLDENPDFQLIAPKPGDPKPMWLNITVPDIRETFDKALKASCRVIQEPIEMEELGIVNAIVQDPFGYMWLLHEIKREVSFEERLRIMEEKMGLKPE